MLALLKLRREQDDGTPGFERQGDPQRVLTGDVWIRIAIGIAIGIASKVVVIDGIRHQEVRHAPAEVEVPVFRVFGANGKGCGNQGG